MTQLPINILLVDDDDVAAEAVERSLNRADIQANIVVAEDGMVALEILEGKHPSRKIQKPFLVLLDLNMPRMNGFEFLENIRNNDKLNETVVFVLSTSDSDADRARAYNENIAGYMVKSAVGPQFKKLVTLLESYANTIKLPR